MHIKQQSRRLAGERIASTSDRATIAQKFGRRAFGEFSCMLKFEWGNFNSAGLCGVRGSAMWDGVPFHLSSLKLNPVEFCARGVEFGVLYMGKVS